MGVVSFKDFEREANKRKRKEWIADKAMKVAEFGRDHKEIIIAIGTGIAIVINGIVRPSIRKHNLKLERNNKELYCYDRSLGHYWRLNRKLTNSDWLEINQRKAEGETLGDILRDLRVLK